MGGELCLELGRHEESLALRMREYVRDLLGREVDHDRHGDRPGPHNAEIRKPPLGPVLRQNRDSVAFLYTEQPEHGRDAPASDFQLSIVDRFVSDHGQGRPFGIAEGTLRDDFVDGELIDSVHGQELLRSGRLCVYICGDHENIAFSRSTLFTEP